MADITFTATEVQPGADAKTRIVTLFEAVTAGQTGFIRKADGQAGLADNNVDAATAETKGIFLGGGAAGQQVVLQTGGDIDYGAAAAGITSGLTVVQSSTPGGIAPVADVASTQFVTHIGVAKDTQVIPMKLSVTGVQVA